MKYLLLPFLISVYLIITQSLLLYQDIETITETTIEFQPHEDNPCNYLCNASSRSGIDLKESFAIARCESGLNPLARNKNSSAKGVFQFLDSTWANNCSGDVFNYKDNIDCFVKHYPKRRSWWNECL